MAVSRFGLGGPSAAYAGFQPKTAEVVIDLDICATTVRSLMPLRAAQSLMPLRETRSLMPRRTVQHLCEDD